MSNIAAASLLALLAMALVSDIRYRRIPNSLVGWGIAGAFILHAVALTTGADAPAGEGALAPLLGLLAGGGALLPLYLMRACGAGDVKLMAMAGAFIGWSSALHAALYTLVAGGVLSVVYMVSRGISRRTLDNVRFLMTDLILKLRTGSGARLEPLAHSVARLPYAIAIAAGTVAALAIG